MSRKIYNRLSFMAVSWLDESTLILARCQMPWCARFVYTGMGFPTGIAQGPYTPIEMRNTP